MDQTIKTLKEKIAMLPKGCICGKKIGGKIRHYLQWTEQGKTKSQYIPDKDFEKTKKDIEKRRELEEKLKSLKISAATDVSPKFETKVLFGPALKLMVQPVKTLQKRDCFKALQEYLHGAPSPRVCSLYGLRRTGKTTLLFQAIEDMPEEDFKICAYIKIRRGEKMAMLDSDLQKLSDLGFKYIFIDEITLMDDFIDTSSFLSDIYAAMGMKIVLSGTDSLGIYLAIRNELYDRSYLIHTTWIPFAEHSRLLKTDDIDDYIRYGGTLRAGETDFDDEELKDESISFRDDESTRRYIDTSICANIQHTLKCFEDGSHFRRLFELYESGELSNAINRIIEDMNHRFLISVLEEDFKSHDLGLAKKNLLREKNTELRSNALEKIDEESVITRLMEILKIKNKESLSVPLIDEHVREIKEYLRALELIEECPVRYLGAKKGNDSERVLFTQPGMRYCQAEALVFSLKKDELFSSLSEREKDYVCTKILDGVKGATLEEIVLYETMRKLKKTHDVFKLEFIDGEFDMVTMDKSSYECNVYEIKHSKEKDPSQYRHIANEERCLEVEKSFGRIAGKYVLYRGENAALENGVEYLNVSEYLRRV